MQMAPYFVKALWDSEAGVFYSDTNIPGLTVEAATVDEFRFLVADLAPEMLAENAGIHDANVVVHFTAEQDMALAVT